MSTFDEARMSGADFAEMNDFDPYEQADSEPNGTAPAATARVINLSDHGAGRFTAPPPTCPVAGRRRLPARRPRRPGRDGRHR
jgi:hypothetical protein